MFFTGTYLVALETVGDAAKAESRRERLQRKCLIQEQLCWERLGAAAWCRVSFLNSPNLWKLYRM